MSFTLARSYGQQSTYPQFYLKWMLEGYGGGGLATSLNYDVATSAGLGFEINAGSGFYLGAHLLLQNYILFYDNEVNGERFGHGYAGVTLNHRSAYGFFLPQIRTRLWSKPGLISWMYLNAGVGNMVQGAEEVHTWDKSFVNYPSQLGPYDTFVNTTANITKMVYRAGFGFSQTLQCWTKLWFTFREDVGYVVSPITASGDINNSNPPRSSYSPQKINPLYVSLQAGLTFMGMKK